MCPAPLRLLSGSAPASQTGDSTGGEAVTLGRLWHVGPRLAQSSACTDQLHDSECSFGVGICLYVSLALPSPFCSPGRGLGHIAQALHATDVSLCIQSPGIWRGLVTTLSHRGSPSSACPEEACLAPAAGFQRLPLLCTPLQNRRKSLLFLAPLNPLTDAISSFNNFTKQRKSRGNAGPADHLAAVCLGTESRRRDPHFPSLQPEFFLPVNHCR